MYVNYYMQYMYILYVIMYLWRNKIWRMNGKNRRGDERKRE